MTEMPATLQSTDDKRQLALLKAVGLDRAAPEQREIALAIANRYDLDLLLKHLVLIEGRPYITRDGLLHVAHRSGVLDGMETSVPEIVGDEWRVTCSVYRKDMSRPFTYTGRYGVKGQNQKFAPEMATKVAESMALRRAFDIAAPAADERWDLEMPAAPPEPRPSLSEVAAAKVATISPPAEADAEAAAYVDDVTVPLEEFVANAAPEPVAGAQICGVPSPYDGDSSCTKELGHKGNHRNDERESW